MEINLKGLVIRYKTFKNSWVSFAESMKKEAKLIALELDGQSAKDSTMEKGERLENSITSRQ